MQTHPAPDTALRDWSTRLRNRASGMLGINHPKQLCEAFARAIDRVRPGQTPIDRQLVAHWLQGDCAPETPELHTAALEALGLFNDSRRYASGSGERMVNMRWDMSVLYAMIDQRFKTVHVDEVLPEKALPRAHIRIGNASAVCMNGNHPAASGIGGHNMRHSNYDDLLDSPPRLKPEHVAYDELSDSELDALLSSGPNGTRNAHEFLSAFLARHRITGVDFADDIGCSRSAVGYVRNGGQLPGKALLPAYEAPMRKYDTHAFRRFEELVIRNRLGHIATIKTAEKADPQHALQNSYAKDISLAQEELPHHYWVELLSRCNHARSKQATYRLPEDLLDEQPIQTKGAYLRAVRYALGMHTVDVVPDTRIHGNLLCRVEHYGDPDGASARERLTNFYSKRDAARVETIKAEGKPAEPFFVAGVYNRLPNSKRSPQAAAGVQHEGRLAERPVQQRQAG